MPRSPLVVVVAAFLLAPTLAAAQQQPGGQFDPVAQEAQQQFTQGREAVKRGEYMLALGLFRKSLELRPTPSALLNLASCEEQLGKVASALNDFETAEKQLPEGDDRIPIAREGIARVKPRVPFLRIERAAGAPATMSIKREGIAMAASTIGVELPVDPGGYTVTSVTAGREDRAYQIKVGEGQHVTVAVEPGKELRGVAGRVASAAGPSPARYLGFAFLGVGVAGIGLGAATGALALVKHGQLAKACPTPARCSNQGFQTQGAADAFTTASIAALVAGGVGGITGIAIVVATRDKPVPAVAIGPTVLPGGGGFGVLGAF